MITTAVLVHRRETFNCDKPQFILFFIKCNNTLHNLTTNCLHFLGRDIASVTQPLAHHFSVNSGKRDWMMHARRDACTFCVLCFYVPLLHMSGILRSTARTQSELYVKMLPLVLSIKGCVQTYHVERSGVFPRFELQSHLRYVTGKERNTIRPDAWFAQRVFRRTRVRNANKEQRIDHTNKRVLWQKKRSFYQSEKSKQFVVVYWQHRTSSSFLSAEDAAENHAER